MAPNGLISTLHDLDESERRERFPGAVVFVLDLGSRPTRTDFFESVAATLPLDPPAGPGMVWDAIRDSLLDGILSLKAEDVVVYWRNAHEFMTADRQSYEIALEVLADASEALASEEATVGQPMNLRVVVNGPLPTAT